MEEVTKNDKVKEILEKLLVTEKYKGKHLKSTFKPERHDNIDEEKKHLDTLARLIVKEEKKGKDEVEQKEERDICVAVCLVEVDGKKCLLVANNLEEPKGPREFLPSLSDFINFASGENKDEAFVKLSKLVIENSFALIGRTSAGVKREKTKIKKTTHAESKDDKTKSIVQKISEYCNQKDRLIKGEVEELIKKILEDYSLKKVDNSDLECLLPINDFNDFIDIIDNESNTNLIEIIKNKSFEYISGKRNEHAEVKIANWLLEIGIMGDYYIGISKLTCSPCHVTIGLINKDDGASLSLNVRGTHGATYGEN